MRSIRIPPGRTDDPVMDAERYNNWLEEYGHPIDEDDYYEEEEELPPLCWREEP